MKCCIVRKVPYRVAGTSRLVWGLVLAENAGLTLLLVPKPDDKHPHTIVIASEDVEQRVYQDTIGSAFPLGDEDLSEIGAKLKALSQRFAESEIERFFRSEDFW